MFFTRDGRPWSNPRTLLGLNLIHFDKYATGVKVFTLLFIYFSEYVYVMDNHILADDVSMDFGMYTIAPDSKVHGANMGPTWVLSVPAGPHVGPMNLAIRDSMKRTIMTRSQYSLSLHNLLSLSIKLSSFIRDNHASKVLVTINHVSVWQFPVLIWCRSV